MQLTPKQTLKIVRHLTSRKSSDGNIKPSMAPYIAGGAGIAKTAIINQLAKEWNARPVALHLGQMDPTDITGIPTMRDDGTVRWVASSKLPARVVRRTGQLNGEYRIVSPYVENAGSISVYGFDENGEEIARYNDISMPDVGVNVVAELTEDGAAVYVSDLDEAVVTVEVSEKAVLFLDEMSTADEATQNAALQLVLDRKVGEYTLPTGVPVIAAGNRTDDGAFVTQMSGPLANRFAHITMVPDLEEWIEYAMRAGLRAEVISYVKSFPSALHDYNNDHFGEGQYAFATPRTMEFLSQNFITPNVDNRQFVTDLFSSIVGEKQAARFIAFVDTFHRFPNTDLVFAGKNPKIDDDIDPSVRFGFLIALLQNLKARYDKLLQNENDDSKEKWEVARDNLLTYVMKNFNRETGQYTVYYLNNVLNIDVSYFIYTKGEVSEVSDKFGSEYLTLSERLRGLE